MVARRACRFAFATTFVASAALVATAPGCSLGDGAGTITGDLNVPGCWSGKFSLNPDFFAAVPYRQKSLILRIQNGGDYQNFSDGVSILVDDLKGIVGDCGGADAGTPVNGVPCRNPALGQALAVSLAPEVTPPGVPIVASPNPASVHAALYLQRSCHTQNVALYAVDRVVLDAAGNCGTREGGDVPVTCGSSTTAGNISPASTITFTQLFNGDIEEADSAKRLNEGSFKFYLADPREICPGGLGPPPPCRGVIEGSFSFFFQRGKPAQPFP